MPHETRSTGQPLTRRGFLAAASAALPSVAVIAHASSSDATALDGRSSHPVIDCHTHFYDPARPEGVPWPNKDDKVLYRRVLPEHFKDLARPLGVTGTVVVEASPWVEDNQWVLDLAKDDPFIVGLVGHLKPGGDEFAEHLNRFAKNCLFRGIRISSGDLLKGLEQGSFIADLKRLADNDLELDVNGGPDMPQVVARLTERLPELRVVINHMANVRIDGKAVPAGWLEGMQAAAKNRRVFCKVSALVEGAMPRQDNAPAELDFYLPMLDAVWDAFGEDRLIFGSNWPVSERFASFGTVLQIVREYFQSKGNAITEKFFWRNAMAAYKWVKR
jgi:predicted TIM-barrel fold metal-dependent hydrolase